MNMKKIAYFKDLKRDVQSDERAGTERKGRVRRGFLNVRGRRRVGRETGKERYGTSVANDGIP